MTEPRVHEASASKDLSAESCLYTLRVDVPKRPDEKHESTKDGDAVHEIQSLVVQGLPWDMRAIVEKHGAKYARCEKLVAALLPWLDSIGDGWGSEVVYVYNARTDTCRMGARGDARTPFELAAIADLVQAGPSSADAWDLKTGKPANVKLSQLEVLAVAISRFHGVSEVMSGFLFVDEQGWHEEPHNFDATALDRIAANLEATLLTIPESEPTPSVKACTWCLVTEEACPQGFPLQKKRRR